MLEMRPSGGTLKRLALVKMIKGQPAAASVFLNVLRDDLVWGRWAEGYLQRLASGPGSCGRRGDPANTPADDRRKTTLHLTMQFHPDGGMPRSRTTPSCCRSLLKQNSRESNGLRVPHGDVSSQWQRARRQPNCSPFWTLLLSGDSAAVRGSGADLSESEHPERRQGDRFGSLLPRPKDQRADDGEVPPLPGDRQTVTADSTRRRNRPWRASLDDSYFYYFFYTFRKRS